MNKLSVAFLWHMHQPMYKDLVTGKYHLPWVRLHSTYSYLDMASILEKFPQVKVTFNITPSLIWQLRDISEGGPVDDTYLQLSEKHARDLTDKDKYFILKNFFSCDPKIGINTSRKYRQLFSRRGNDLSSEELTRKSKSFTEADFRDLQVLFNLAWCGFTLRREDAPIRYLVRKGSNYTEEDKAVLLKRQKEVVRSILPTYKRLQSKGRIEITTSPFYHPILPLLCRDKLGDESSFLQDAKVQVKKAIDLYKEVFGTVPRGMWPSEGAVSQEIIPLLADEGIEWMATDEEILLESFKEKDLKREDLLYDVFTAHENGKEIDMVFRDAAVSNAIGFQYTNMSSRRAAADLLRHIKVISKTSKTHEEKRVAAIMLDGENPWPYYADGGRKFLKEIYRHLSLNKNIDLVTVSEHIASCGAKKRIEKLFSGSWINHNFNKWIGSPQKDKAWEYLKKAREDLFASGKPSPEALEELYIAEGSDWFWWYDDFGSELNFVFDELFRMHLQNMYNLSGKKPPGYLLEPVLSGISVPELIGVSRRGEMARPLKVLIASSEVFPFSKTGGLADVAGSLPKALTSPGMDVRVITPLYKCVTDEGFELTKEASIPGHLIPGKMSGFDLYANRTSDERITYFVENKKYFEKEGLYGNVKGDYPDNGQRFAFFSRASLEAIKAIDFKPDIIHCNDWQTALIPFYLRHKLGDDNFFRGIKTLFTIHNMAYQGVFSRKVMHFADIPKHFFNARDLEFYGKLNFMKSGILYSDLINTVSRKYAEEMMTPEYGAGLDGLLRTRRDAIYGVHNGVDYNIWSPEKDSFIKCNFKAKDVDKKSECKKDLLEYTRLEVSPDAPLLGIVARLTEQKGMDLVAEVMSKVAALGAGIVILGSGSKRYNKLFQDLMKKYPKNVYVCNDFNDELAHKIEAGCDMFLMPSRYEPCGLNQMYSVKYGTIPIVRATGGLDDAIVDFDEDRERGNGFKFIPATGDALCGTIERAIKVYRDKAAWKRLMLQAMSYDFSWEHSARQYLELYRKLTK